jgi:alpha-ketoglutarate-dependent taurine dioxygenase
LSADERELFALLLGGEGLDVEASPVFAPRPSSGVFPLSSSQKRLWVLDRLSPGDCTYNVASALRLTGRLDVGALTRSLNEVVRRHDSLRTTFGSVDGRGIQVVGPMRAVDLAIVCLLGLSATDLEVTVTRLAVEEARRSFDLTGDWPIRCILFRRAPDEHVLLVTLHHIIADAWSLGVMVREIAALYAAFSSGRPSPLRGLTMQCTDFALWEEQWLRSEGAAAQLAYWKDRLRGELPRVELPLDRPRPAVRSGRGATRFLVLPEELAQALRSFSESEGVTLFMTLLAGFGALLHRYSGQTDVVVGTGCANRNRLEAEELIGFFANLLVLRTDLSGNPSFRELVGRVRQVAVEASAHQELPFDRLVHELMPERSLSETPLLQALLVLQNAPFELPAIEGLAIEPLEVDPGIARFDLTLFVADGPKGLRVMTQYNADIFEDATIQEMLRRFAALLRAAVARPDGRIGTLDLTVPFRECPPAAEPPASGSIARRLSSARRLAEARPHAVSLAGRDFVRIGGMGGGEGLPAVIEPAGAEVDLTGWSAANWPLVESLLHAHGAVLFRGFPVGSVGEFESFARATCGELFAENGELPRTQVGGRVYTSVRYPRDRAILWHNENSFAWRWPRKISFCCLRPAEEGGETPVVDSRRVFHRLPPALRERFLRKGVLYLRNYGVGPGLSWPEVFQTASRVEVEAQCRRASMQFEWVATDRLRTWCIRPAVVRHSTTAETSWFNQAQHWHIACLDPETRESLVRLFPENELPRQCYYGDGSQIEAAVMDEICAVYRELEVVFPWRAADVLLLDNVLTAHGRRPFQGEREILVAMGDMAMYRDGRLPDGPDGDQCVWPGSPETARAAGIPS